MNKYDVIQNGKVVVSYGPRHMDFWFDVKAEENNEDPVRWARHDINRDALFYDELLEVNIPLLSVGGKLVGMLSGRHYEVWSDLFGINHQY